MSDGDRSSSSYYDKWRGYFLLFCDDLKPKVEEAISMLRSIDLDRAIISVSGGKDSMALLHIATRLRSDVNVFHWDHGAALMPREIEEEILRNIKRIAPGARLIVRRYSVEDERARWDYKRWYAEFFSTLRRLGYEYHVLGIRAEESYKRAARGAVVRRDRWIEVYPIYSWTWRDVWTYIFCNDVPVPSVYAKYVELLGWERARLVTFFDREFEKYGAPQIDGFMMWRYRHTSPPPRCNKHSTQA